MAIDTLLPKKLDKNEDASSYKSVIELNEALSIAKKEHIRNIALTGPFGSGKSSILRTLMEDYAEEHKYLPISLATLQANEETLSVFTEDKKVADKQNDKSKEDDLETIDNEGDSADKEEQISVDNKDRRIENLNRKIEYSILQQLIYREKTSTVPHSRFRRIAHLSKWELFGYPLCCILTIICILIVFEPSFLRVDSICKRLDFGNKWNSIADVIASACLILALYGVFIYLFRSLCNSRLNKLNLKDGEIQVVKDNSIFNKHLDEILYFFQVTEYDVVIIEDLDRFGTPNIFLKLRELNQLINESKIVGRHITFVYAVKDDIFKDEERTKFFDFITTVIPVINPSNSKDKLKAALEKKGCGNDGIADDDLSEMAFFIQDMRILTNIVNEYSQYRDKLCSTDKIQLNRTNLLGMIVYKNYYPQDFASLHRREGKVYKCISSKPKFISYALKAIDEYEKALEKKENIFKQNENLSKTDLRRLFLFRLLHNVSQRIIAIRIDNKFFALEDIASNEDLFSKLISMSTINYQYYSGYTYNDTKTIDFSRIDSDINFSQRIDLLEKGEAYFTREHKRIQKERIKVKSLKLKDLIKQYKLGENDEYKKLLLEPMMNVFIRRGYLDEDYYDYISYFYEGMVSLADRELLLSMKTEEGRPYDYHIDKIENFVKELKDYMFESDAILNIDLLNYLASHKALNEKFEHVMYRIECGNAPLQFLSQYYTEGRQQQKVFKHYIDYQNSWSNILNWGNTIERDNLIEGYLKYCSNLGSEQQEWLNRNYRFLSERCDNITLEQSLRLASTSCFVDLCEGSDDLLDYVIEHNCYKISLDNMFLITKHLHKDDKTVSASNLNYTRIKATNNTSFIGYVDSNISSAIKLFKDESKDESPESLIFILTSGNITPDIKASYLTGQHNHIENFGEITDKSMYDVAVKSKVILPTWENVLFYFNHKNALGEDFVKYINHYAKELSINVVPNSLAKIEELYASLFGSNVLEIENYRSLLKCFSGDFIEFELLKQVNKERLIVLVNSGRIPFEQDAITVMNETEAFAEYIIYHSEAFVENLGLEYSFNINDAYDILSRGHFSIDDKYAIIGILPDDVLQKSQPLADIVIKVFAQKQQVNVESDVLVGLLRISSDKSQKIQLITSLMRNGYNDFSYITRFLLILGDAYADVSDKEKRAKLSNDELNIGLLEVLRKIGFISSFKLEKDQLRIYHKVQK